MGNQLTLPEATHQAIDAFEKEKQGLALANPEHLAKLEDVIAQLRTFDTEGTETALNNVVKSMIYLNKTIKLPRLQSIMSNFMGRVPDPMKRELVRDALEDAMKE